MSTVGDVGYVDDDNFLHLTDRAPFMIISGGVNIYPQECENLLFTHPKVADAAVFRSAERRSCPVWRPVRIWPRSSSSSPGGTSVAFEAELPRLPTVKLYKRLLRDRYWGDKASRIV